MKLAPNSGQAGQTQTGAQPPFPRQKVQCSCDESEHWVPAEMGSRPELSLLLATLLCAEGPWANRRARQRPQLQVTQREHGRTRHPGPEGGARRDGEQAQCQAGGVGDTEPDG